MIQTVLLGDVLEISKESLNPSKFPDTLYDVFSIPGYDIGAPEKLRGDEIKSNKFVVKPGSILVSKLNPRIPRVWKVDRANVNSISSTEFVVLKVKSQYQYLFDFLYAAVSSEAFSVFLQSRVKGTSGSHQRIKPEDIYDYKVAIDSEQSEKTGEFIKAIDEKIELNRQMNETLEQMGQALFRHYFIDNPEVKNWEEVKIKDISKYISRGVSPKYDESGDSLVINQRCIRGGRLNLANARRQSKPVSIEKFLVKGDVLINSTGVGTLGRVAQVDDIDSGVTFDSHVTIVRPNIDSYFFGQMMRNLEPIFTDMGRGSTGQTELSRIAVGEVNVKLPPKVAIEKFSTRLSAMREKMKYNDIEIQTLTILRGTLLPRLISGKISTVNKHE